MQISEIYKHLENGTLLDSDEARFTAMIAIELLAKVEDVTVTDLDLAAPHFACKYPANKRDYSPFWHGSTHYQAWRKTILDAQMLAAPGNTDGNEWQSLYRTEQLGLNRSASTLYYLAKHLPAGSKPQDVSDGLISSTFSGLNTQDQSNFRASVNGLRRLFDCELAQQTGLLPHIKPTPLPGQRNHIRFTTMASEISAARTSIKQKNTRFAFNYVHRLAVAGGLLDGVRDTLEDLRKAIPGLPNPADVGVPPIKPKTLRVYINEVLHHIGGRDYRLTEVEQAWSDLRKMARAAGFKTSALFNISMPASAAGLMPSEISADWAHTVITYHKNRGCRAKPTQCRIGCEQLDALRGALPDELLPPVSLGIRRSFPVAKPPQPPKDPVVVAWDELYSEITKNVLITKEYKHLWFIRGEAIKKHIAPENITQEWLEELRDSCPNDRLSHVYGGVNELLKISGFQHLRPLRHRRQRHGGLPENLEHEFEAVAATMGMAPTTYRSLKLAIGVLAEHLSFDDNASLEDVRAVDVSVINWPCVATKGKIYSNSIKQFQKYLSLPWTPEWRALQKIVVNTGMKLKANPIPKLLTWNPAPSPRLVSLQWAQQLDRDLRSTVLNRPHGRADLAKTMAKHVAEFDQLRDIPDVAASGFMPEPIGVVRPKC